VAPSLRQEAPVASRSAKVSWGLLALALTLWLTGCPPSSLDPAPPGDFAGSDPGSANADHGQGEGDGDDDGSSDPDDPQGSCDLQAVMARSENGCTNAGCHGAQYQGGLDLLSEGLEERLVGAVSTTDACGGQPIVDLEDIDRSLLLRMIDKKRYTHSPCGVMMPLGSTEGVSADTLACFESFVRGLRAEDPPPDAPAFEPLAPISYVNKVKTLLTGYPASAEEIARVEGKPRDLKELVASWVDTPEFTQKLEDFLRVNLQQRVARGFPTLFMTLRGERLPAFRANIEESFVRTTAQIVAENRPFTEILTTRRWAMTTATLAALAFVDQTENKLTNTKHQVIRGKGVDSLENRVWHVASMPDTCTPQSPIPSYQMIDLMLGFSACKGMTFYRFTDSLLSDEDFEDWRMVDLEQVNSAADVPLFYDVAKLRKLERISLMQPRMGFFSTPAFLESWPTNEDNQFRVTTSQTLIVALGEIFSPADPTMPVRLDGLAKAHAKPGTTCYGCHQFLDPMREYFTRNYSFGYHRAERLGTITPSFAFHGKVHDGGTLTDFAATLAGHPDFAPAWVQKLCYWANSQACDKADPEFQRIAQAFAANGYKFKELVVELFSSRLVTFSAPSESEAAPGPFVSITRKQHLCQLLSVRLGIEDACQEARNFAGLIPEDDVSRGSAEPVQTGVTGLFHYAAAEKLCTRLASVLVGTGDGMHFSVSDPEHALDAFVSDLMGFGPTDARALGARAQLASHYERAKAQTNAQAGLRSAFVIACMAPEVMAVGL
jgi:hypothetical protein